MHTQDLKPERTSLYGRKEISTKITRWQFFIEYNKDATLLSFIDTILDFLLNLRR